MRLSPAEREAILAAAHRLGADTTVWLYGSRVDDSRRGGDIDLLLESGHRLALSERSAFLAELWRRLGERKIDLVTHCRGEPPTPFVAAIREGAVRIEGEDGP